MRQNSIISSEKKAEVADGLKQISQEVTETPKASIFPSSSWPATHNQSQFIPLINETMAARDYKWR